MDADRHAGAPVEASGLIRPLVQGSTPELIAGMIRNAIAAGEFEPGTQLREKQLAERLAVSRGPLREALQRLIQEGLLRAERNRGVYVQDLDAGRIADVYLVRGALERCAIHRVHRQGLFTELARIIKQATLTLRHLRSYRTLPSRELRPADYPRSATEARASRREKNNQPPRSSSLTQEQARIDRGKAGGRPPVGTRRGLLIHANPKGVQGE